MTTISPPMCVWCSRFERTTFSCAAFPDGIPNALTLRGADHRLPIRGDNGILFEPIDDAAEETVDELWGDEPTQYRGPTNPADPTLPE